MFQRRSYPALTVSGSHTARISQIYKFGLLFKTKCAAQYSKAQGRHSKYCHDKLYLISTLPYYNLRIKARIYKSKHVRPACQEVSSF